MSASQGPPRGARMGASFPASGTVVAMTNL